MTTTPTIRPRVLVDDDQTLAMLATGHWDLLLTDLRMPCMDGTRLVAQAMRAVEQARAANTREEVLAVGAHPDDVVITTLSRGAAGGDADVRATEAAAEVRT